VTHFTALVLYVGALALWGRSLIGGDRSPPGWIAPSLAAAGVFAHLVALASYASRFGELPLIGLAPSLSTLALVTGVGLVATLTLGEAGGIGLLLLPLMILLEGAALLMGIEPAPASLDFQGAWFSLHVGLAFAALAAMAVSGAMGTLYLAQHRELKHKRMGRVFRFLPPLATLARVGGLAATTSLVLLTLGLGLGWAWTVSFRRSLEGGDPKTLWSIFIWGVILSTVLARRGGVGRERRGASASLVGFILIVMSYVVFRLVGDGGLFL